MKKPLFALMLLPVITISQNRFEKVFTKADSAFNEAAKVAAIQSAKETDSICGVKEKPFFYESIWKLYNEQCYRTMSIKEDELLNLFADGYMAGQLSYFYNKDFDYEVLYRKLNKIKIELNKLSPFGTR
ncbi:MAG: hypothetical protein PHT07_23855 [Paludibacter sp.]|nr:hypothetical protein [Paludibacter sp.]